MTAIAQTGRPEGRLEQRWSVQRFAALAQGAQDGGAGAHSREWERLPQRVARQASPHATW